jgi:hypothetical protein
MLGSRALLYSALIVFAYIHMLNAGRTAQKTLSRSAREIFHIRNISKSIA